LDAFFGLRRDYGELPLIAAKLAFEAAVLGSGMAWTNFVGNFFMEVWLSPALGFDYPNRRVTYFDGGRGRNWWLSYPDLAEAAVHTGCHPKS